MPLTLSGSNGVAGVDGSAGTPALQGSDSNTGIAFGADTIIGSTGGSERFRVDSSGRLGIGTTSPGARLHANLGTDKNIWFHDHATSSTAISSVNDAGSAYAQLSIQAAPLILRNSTTEAARIDSSGRLLVGTTSSDWTRPRVVIVGNPNETTTGAGVLYLQKANGTVAAGDKIGEIAFSTSSSNVGVYAEIICEGDATGGAADFPGRFVFKTCTDGGSSTVERMRIDSAGRIKFANLYDNTSATGRTVLVQSTGELVASTSSIKYKTSVETIEDSYADAILQIRPVWYKSLCTADNPDWGWWGFIAEEVAEVDPRLVQWKTSEVSHDENGAAIVTELDAPEPEGVYYDRFVPHLLNLIKRQQAKIESLETRLAALEVT